MFMFLFMCIHIGIISVSVVSFYTPKPTFDVIIQWFPNYYC